MTARKKGSHYPETRASFGGTKIRTFMGKQNLPKNRDATPETFLNASFKTGIEEIIEGFNDFVKHLDNVMPDILVEALEPTFGKALEYCPQDTGELRASGYLETESYRGGSAVAIGFGRGGHPNYTIYVHEMPYKHEAPTRSKFLQAALDEGYYSILNSIPRLIREAAGT